MLGYNFRIKNSILSFRRVKDMIAFTKVTICLFILSFLIFACTAIKFGGLKATDGVKTIDIGTVEVGESVD